MGTAPGMTFDEIDERYHEAALDDHGDAWDEGPARPEPQPEPDPEPRTEEPTNA